MRKLADQVVAHQCPKHDSPYCFVYNGILQDNESRMMCDECINPQIMTENLIHVKKAFRFLEEQQIYENTQIYLFKASIWQRYKQSQVQIVKMLNALEFKVIDLINSIQETELNTQLSDEYLDKLQTQQNIESLGQQLCNWISQDNYGKYKLKQAQTNKDECCIQCDEIFKVLKDVIQELSGLIDLKYCQLQQEQQQVKELKVQVDNSKYYYETKQTIKVQSLITWLCFNHDETQIIAACGQFILIFELILQGEWAQREFSPLGHGDHIWKVKFNYNSTLVASCSSDRMIFIWNKQLDGKWCIQDKLSSHKDRVYSICFNNDSTLLASGSQDKTIIIHAHNNGKWIIQQILTEHADYVFDVCFNHNTTMLASASKIIIIWQLDSQGKWIVKQKLDVHTLGIIRLQFNYDDTQLVSFSSDQTINIYSTDEDGIWKSKQTLSGHDVYVKSGQINIQSNVIVSSGDDLSIKIWKLNNEHKWECTQTILEYNDGVDCTIISSDSSMIISGSSDQTIQVHKRKLIQ